MQDVFSFFDDEEESEQLIERPKTDKFETAETSEIYVWCKFCQTTHNWLECMEGQIN